MTAPNGARFVSSGILQLAASATNYYTFHMRRTDPISFRIKAEIKEALRRLAKADNRSLSSYIELALEEHIEAGKRGGKRR
jgi:hypothetical protein